MKIIKKYSYLLVVIFLVVIFSLRGSFSFKNLDNTNVFTSDLDCIHIKSSSEFLHNYVDNSLYIINISSNCKEVKDIELSMNVFNDTLVSLKNILVSITGDYTLESEFSLLDDNKVEDNLLSSKKLLRVSVNPDADINLNISNSLIEDGENYLIGKIDYKVKNSKDYLNQYLSSKSNVLMDYDNDGVTSYFPGDSSNNYVEFNDKLFRVVRVNGDGSIRLILNEGLDSKYSEEASTLDDFNYNESLGKSNLDKWYENFSKYDDYIIDNKFCDVGVNLDEAVVVDSERVVSENVSFKCDTITGKVGLLTVDEVMMIMTEDDNYFYDKDSKFMTMSASKFEDEYAYIYGVDQFLNIVSYFVDSDLTIRPVINIKGDVLYSGKGTKESPIVIDF